MPLIEICPESLLGGYALKQEGEFYQAAGIRVDRGFDEAIEAEANFCARGTA